MSKQIKAALDKAEKRLSDLSDAGVDMDDEEELEKHGVTFTFTFAVSCKTKECRGECWGVTYDELEEPLPGYHKDFKKLRCYKCGKLSLYRQ